jgi:hypothetical protein
VGREGGVVGELSLDTPPEQLAALVKNGQVRRLWKLLTADGGVQLALLEFERPGWLLGLIANDPTPWSDLLRASEQRLFVADCIEQLLPLYEALCPGDTRPRRALLVSRAYAFGKASREELDAACEVGRAVMKPLSPEEANGFGAFPRDFVTAYSKFFPASVCVAVFYAGEGDTPRALENTNMAIAIAAAAQVEAEGGRRWQARRLLAYLCGEVPVPRESVVARWLRFFQKRLTKPQ